MLVMNLVHTRGLWGSLSMTGILQFVSFDLETL